MPPNYSPPIVAECPEDLTVNPKTFIIDIPAGGGWNPPNVTIFEVLDDQGVGLSKATPKTRIVGKVTSEDDETTITLFKLGDKTETITYKVPNVDELENIYLEEVQIRPKRFVIFVG